MIELLLPLLGMGALGANNAFDEPRAKSRDVRIVFVGDSNTRGTPSTSHGKPVFPGDPNPIAEPFKDGPYGGGAGGKSGYVNLLRQRLGRGFELHNRGSGGTRALVWASDEKKILTEVARLNPNVVVLYVGLSGIVLNEKQADFEAAMPKLVDTVRAWPAVTKVLIVNVPPVSAKAPAGMADTIKSYNEWLAKWVPSQKGITLVDIHRALADKKGHLRLKYLDVPDLYHQNYNGHYEVAQCLFDAFLDTRVLGPKGRARNSKLESRNPEQIRSKKPESSKPTIR